MREENAGYAVALDAPLLSLFRWDGDRWISCGSAKRWEAITIWQLERSLGDRDLMVFPFGWNPDQIWASLYRAAQA